MHEADSKLGFRLAQPDSPAIERQWQAMCGVPEDMDLSRGQEFALMRDSTKHSSQALKIADVGVHRVDGEPSVGGGGKQDARPWVSCNRAEASIGMPTAHAAQCSEPHISPVTLGRRGDLGRVQDAQRRLAERNNLPGAERFGLAAVIGLRQQDLLITGGAQGFKVEGMVGCDRGVDADDDA